MKKSTKEFDAAGPPQNGTQAHAAARYGKHRPRAAAALPRFGMAQQLRLEKFLTSRQTMINLLNLTDTTRGSQEIVENS